MTITDAMIEAGAKEIRLQLGSFGVFMSANTCSHIAKDVLEAAERAAWRPIEEAPRDGGPIDVWSEDYGRVTDAMLLWGKWSIRFDNGARHALNPQPTHFRPTPGEPDER